MANNKNTHNKYLRTKLDWLLMDKIKSDPKLLDVFKRLNNK